MKSKKSAKKFNFFNKIRLKKTIKNIHKKIVSVSKSTSMQKLKSIILFLLNKFANAFYSFVLGIIVGFIASYLFQELIGEKQDRKTTAQITSHFDKRVDSILTVTNLAEKVSIAIELYKNNEKANFASLYNEIFLELSNQISVPSAKLYYYKKDFRSAALEILEADKLKPSWDYSLWKELAICIKRYSEDYSLSAALEFVDEAKSKVNSKILSYAWVVMPKAITLDLYESIYSRDKLINLSDHDKGEIKYIVKKYKDDPFIDLLQFILMDYDRVINKKSRSLIKDVALYAKGYDGIIKIKDTLEMGIIGVDPKRSNAANLSQAEVNNINEYKKSLIMLIDQFPYSKLADDAAFWIAWIEWKMGKINTALKWLDGISRLGNGDYDYFGDQLEEQILLSMPDDELTDKLIREKRLNNRASTWYSLISRNYNKNNFKSAENILKIARTYINMAEIKSKIYEDKLNYLRDAIGLINEAKKSNTAKDYKSIGNKFRRDYRDFSVATYLFNQALIMFPESNLVDNIVFLKILTYRDWKPSEMNDLVYEFEIKHPTSRYVDDAIAEMAFTELLIKNNLAEGNKIVRYLLSKYPNGNACDNALNWLAISLMKSKKYKEAKKIYKEIIKRFPKSRFAKYGRSNINSIDDLI